MNDILDVFDWEEMGINGTILEEFTEDEMAFLGIENDHGEWQNEDLDAFS